MPQEIPWKTLGDTSERIPGWPEAISEDTSGEYLDECIG